jgi:hypothetical protein
MGNMANSSYENILSLLKRNDLTSSEIEAVAGSRFISQYKIQKAILFNPSTPLKISLQYINYLRYRDLENLAACPFIPHILKTKSEKLLVIRYSSLTLGEKSELSKRTRVRALLYLLLDENNQRIWEYTLINPSLLEKDLVLYIRTRLKNGILAQYILESPRWRVNYAINRSLAYNCDTPVQELHKIAGRLLIRDMSEIFRDDSVKSETKTVIWHILKKKIFEMDENMQILLCESSNRWVLNALIEQSKPVLIKKLLKNRHISKNQLMIIKNNISKITENDIDKREILACIRGKL